MTDTIYSFIYKKLIRLAPQLFKVRVGTGLVSKSEGLMDLHLDMLIKEKDFVVIALTHYYKLNGDMVPDPDMEIKVYSHQMAEALTYQDIRTYQRVYPEKNKVTLVLKKQLNEFLNQWLTNCINQGHSFDKKGK